MLADQPCCFGFGVRSRYNAEGYEHLVRDGKIREALCQADLTIGNLECAYNNQEPMAFATHAMCTNRKAVGYLQSLGLGLLGLANNHTLERGTKGLQELIEVLDAHGIAHVGVNDPFMYDFNGHKVGVLAYTAVPDYKNEDAIEVWDDVELEHIREVSGEADFTVVNIHWGNEFIEVPSQEQITLGRALIDAGANLVLGAHPHVLQAVERYNDGMIVYSMGNFIFDNFLDTGCETAVFIFDIDLETGAIHYEVVPAIVSCLDYSLRSADEVSVSRIRTRLRTPVVPLAQEEYNRRVIARRRDYRKAVLLHYARNVLRYKSKAAVFKWALKRLVFVVRNRNREHRNPSEVYTWK